MPADLRSHLRLLEERGRLARIKREVDPKFELTAVLKHVVSRGQAALFERVKGSNLPLVSNIIGTREMLALAFGTTPARVVEKWSSCSNNPIEPVLASEGPVKEVVKIGDAASIDDLPLPTHCGKDAGPYITAGLVIARDPETELRNVSINRMMYRSARETGLRMMPPQHLGLIQEKAERLGKPLEVAIAIGNHPFEMVVAATSFALGQDEFTLSGGLVWIDPRGANNGRCLSFGNAAGSREGDRIIPRFSCDSGNLGAGYAGKLRLFGDFRESFICHTDKTLVALLRGLAAEARGKSA